MASSARRASSHASASTSADDDEKRWRRILYRCASSPPVRGARASFLRSLGRLLTASLDSPPPPPPPVPPPPPRRQPYPDNHTDDTFLEHLVLNGRIVPRRLSRVVLDALTVSQQIAVVTLKACAAAHLLSGRWSALALVRADFALLALFLLLTASLRGRAAALRALVRTGPLVVLGIAALAPLFRTMTEAISDDTAVASAVASLFLHLLTHDYAFLNDRTARLGGTVSHGAAMFASALISSRLENLDAVFADALLAAVLFILFPFARRDVRVVAGADAHVALTLAAHLAALAALRAIPAASGRAVFVGGYLVAALAVAFAAPVALVRAMRFKRQINGPWDEAKVAAE